MYKTGRRTVVRPTDRTLHIEKHITAAYVNRYLRQVVDITLTEVFLFLRTTITEHTQTRRLQTCCTYLIKTHTAYTGLAHAYLHPFTTRQNRLIGIGMDAGHHRQAQGQQ